MNPPAPKEAVLTQHGGIDNASHGSGLRRFLAIDERENFIKWPIDYLLHSNCCRSHLLSLVGNHFGRQRSNGGVLCAEIPQFDLVHRDLVGGIP